MERERSAKKGSVKLISLVVTFLLLCISFCGCSASREEKSIEGGSTKTSTYEEGSIGERELRRWEEEEAIDRMYEEHIRSMYEEQYESDLEVDYEYYLHLCDGLEEGVDPNQISEQAKLCLESLVSSRENIPESLQDDFDSLVDLYSDLIDQCAYMTY